MKRLKADDAAFSVYHILYYPLFDALFPSENGSISPSDASITKALTVQENLAGTPYKLTRRSLTSLALAYDRLEMAGLSGLLIDPAADVRSFVPESGKPLYPDFPSQVLAMSEEDFRKDQVRHYASTYGVELLSSVLGVPLEVGEGWRPQGTTEKRHKDETLVEKQLLDIVLSPRQMLNFVEKDVARPARMHPAACNLLVGLISRLPDERLPRFAFHENMMEVMTEASRKGSRALYDTLSAVAQHPGDIFKSILWLREKHGKAHLTTAQKKGFCRAIEQYDRLQIAQNLADLSKSGLEAAYMLSPARFGGERLRYAIEAVRSKEVRSFNSNLELAWKDPTLMAGDLVRCYAHRPGVLLRSATRLIKAGVNPNLITEALLDHVDSLSVVTLVSLASQDGMRVRSLVYDPFLKQGVKIGRHLYVDPEVWPQFQQVVKPLLARKLSLLDTPLSGRRVYVAPTPFSLEGSVIIPNEVGQTDDTYPPTGMAYDLPADKTLRFFTSWNDQERNDIDVDAHFFVCYQDGSKRHLGWNAAYSFDGLVTSGDVTVATNSAEYLDIDMAEALSNGVESIVLVLHIYNGYENWEDIEACFSGALVVGDTEPDAELYNSENILFHDDIDGEGTVITPAYVDIPRHFVRILRGEDAHDTWCNLDTFLGMLFEGQGVQRVQSLDDADCIITVGRDDTDYHKDTYCLIDEHFFL